MKRIRSLYRGPFVDGDDRLGPVLVARERLHGRFLRTLTAVAARDDALGRHERAAHGYRAILEHDPLAEDVSRRLIRCCLAQGLRAEAWDVYRRCRDNLSIILGVALDPQTERLAALLREPGESANR
ncbi:MAG: bacterial transcriptional activator domain-containing protein [Lautropia sp.]